MLEVLVVDDQKINQEVMSKYFKNIGIPFKISMNGLDAVEVVKETPDRIGLIFMDLQMPLMDGVEATQKILKINSEIPIYGLTIIDCPVDHEECLQIGMCEVIIKPVTQKKIIKILRRHVLIDKKRIRKIKVHNFPPPSPNEIANKHYLLKVGITPTIQLSTSIDDID